MCSRLDCTVCFEEYDNNVHKPRIGACGHSVCSNCVVSLQNFSCPQCRRINSFQGAPPNFQLFEALTVVRNLVKDLERETQKNQNLSDLLSALETQLELQSVHNRLLEKQLMSESSYFACSECGFHVRQDRSRICIDCGVANGAVYTFTDRPNAKCFLYPKADEHILCGSCALDGDHRDHNTQFYLPLKLASRSDLFLNGNKDADPLNDNRLVDEMNEIVSRSKAFQQNINSLIGLSMMSNSIAEYEDMEEKLSELMRAHSQATIEFKQQLTAYSSLIRDLQTRFDEVMTSKVHGAVQLSDDESSITDEFAPGYSSPAMDTPVFATRPPISSVSAASTMSTPVIAPSSAVSSPRNGREMWELRIDTRDDDFIILRVSSEDVGRSVKQRINERLGIPLEEQVLVFNGKTLLNDVTLRSIGLSNNQRILLYSL